MFDQTACQPGDKASGIRICVWVFLVDGGGGKGGGVYDVHVCIMCGVHVVCV